MGKYCDSEKLERNWFHWLLSSSVPSLELYRELGLLWTKVVGRVDGQVSSLLDPMYPTRVHCVALATPVYLNSYKGIPQSNGTVFTDEGPHNLPLPSKDNLDLLSDSWLPKLGNLFTQRDMVIPNLENKGYVRELPTDTTWHAMLRDINNMCLGIAMRFKQPSEEEQLELANEALVQVTNKLASYKLVYIPGKAPVFNLLTTTIYRCMYSIMNRRKTQRQKHQKFVSDVQVGVVPQYNGPKRKAIVAR